MTIGPFKDDYRWLSNFWDVPVTIAGVEYLTNEHFYQASKCLNIIDSKLILESTTPGKAKRIGSCVIPRPDWDEVKISVMNLVSFSKFTQHPDLAYLLMETYDEEIVELNHWHDNFWGQCTCNECDNVVGKNNLGVILMNVRSYLNTENINIDRNR